jgi:hypothetical protein
MGYQTLRAAGVRIVALALLAVFAKSIAADESTWKSMFDGMSLSGWKPTNFGGEGEVIVKDGSIVMDFGASITGITYTREFPKTNYEVRLEAMRADGRDFFCGLTFPVAESHCSFIVGGWGGAIVGLSSIDGKDASENETTKFIKFDNGRWYRFRVQVTPERIKAWIDDEVVIDQSIEGRKITTRSEVDLSKPLGFAAYETKAMLRKIEYRVIGDRKDGKDRKDRKDGKDKKDKKDE